MKVMQVLPELNSGGVERGTVELACYLQQQNHEAVVVSNGGRMVAQLEATGARHIEMAVHRKSPSSLFQVRKFRRMLIEEKPDILHVRSRVPAWIAYLAWRKLPAETRPRLVSTVHGFYSVSPYSEIMCRGERVIVVSESVRDYVHVNYPKTDHEKIRRVYRGVDPASYFPTYAPNEKWLAEWQTQFPQTKGKQLLVLPGRITRLKGHADFFDLIESLKLQFPDVHGLVVGNTHPKKQAYFEELQATVKKRGLEEAITFTGHRSDLREIMAISSVICALSQQPESFGRTALEAMALGKPLVGYDCGGVGELLGKIFPKGRVALGDVTALKQVAAEILSSENHLEIEQGAFTLEAMCCETVKVYQELLHL